MSNYYTCDEYGQSVDGHADNHDCPGPPLRQAEVDDAVDRIVNARLHSIAERLRVPHGGLVPDAEVYVRAMLAKVIEEELEER
jgi:hypothetical protein